MSKWCQRCQGQGRGQKAMELPEPRWGGPDPGGEAEVRRPPDPLLLLPPLPPTPSLRVKQMALKSTHCGLWGRPCSFSIWMVVA